MFAAMPWTTIAPASTTSTAFTLVRSATATNGLSSPVAAPAQPPTTVVTSTAVVAEANSPIRMSRRVGV